MASKSLKKRIDDLIHALGGATKPSYIEIRNELAVLSPMAEALEDGQATREKDARIADLEAELGSLKSELGNLNVLLQTANSEIAKFRADQKKRDEQERDIPPIQFEILERLPSEHGGEWLAIDLIALVFNIPVDETEIHLDRLEKAGFAVRRQYLSGQVVWHRSMKGNELVLAKRLAGKDTEEQKPKRKPHPDLSHAEQIILLIVAKTKGLTADEIFERYTKAIPIKGRPIATLGMIQLLLIKLRGKNMASDADGMWVILSEGREYLVERNIL